MECDLVNGRGAILKDESAPAVHSPETIMALGHHLGVLPADNLLGIVQTCDDLLRRHAIADGRSLAKCLSKLGALQTAIKC